MKVRVDEKAYSDAIGSYQHYEGCRPNLGSEFLEGVRNAIAEVAAAPLLYPPFIHGTRCRRVKRFPYAVIYLVIETEDMVHVIAVSHLSRDQRFWAGRVEP